MRTAASAIDVARRVRSTLLASVVLVWQMAPLAASAAEPSSPTSIFAPVSTPADAIFEVSLFVLAVAAGIFVTVFGLLTYAVLRFGRHTNDDGSEPPQVVRSYEVELAWTTVSVLIVAAPLL